MNLVYTETGLPVHIGDLVKLSDGKVAEVKYFAEPHKPSSSGKVSVETKNGWDAEYYVSVIGAKWINREDQ